ncbi:hypothetical protein [Burkholderia pseudomallei]|uniref:hypothetical protein n=1 Tax=Burkholderia pseudomallei TaxID=28450 RepID=UPI003F65F183
MTYGESVPRAAVEMACTEYDGVDSFPSCAIVTGNFHARRHDEDDLRAIDGMGMGVSDAMRCGAVLRRALHDRDGRADRASRGAAGAAHRRAACREPDSRRAGAWRRRRRRGAERTGVAPRARASARAKSERAARHARCVRRRAVVLHAAARMKARAAAVFHCTSMRRGRASSRLGIVSFNTPS